MSQAVQCVCGSRFAAQPHLAGKTVACPSCGSPLHVPAPRQTSPQAVPSAAVNSITGNRITVSCLCGGRFAAEPRLAGQRLACPSCGQPLTVPSGSSTGLDGGLDFSGLASPGQDAWQTGSTPFASPTVTSVDEEGLTTPIKIAIGVGGGAVVLLLLAVIVSSFVMPGMSRDEASPAATVTAEGTVAAETTQPASESALSSVGNFISGIVTGKPKTYATPQAVFDAYWRARENQDIKALLGTISPDQHELMVAEMIYSLVQMRLLDDKVTDGLEKFGLDFNTINLSTSSQELHRVASTVENRSGFLKAASDRLTESRKRLAKENAEAGRELLEAAMKARDARLGQMTPEERAQRERARKEFAKPPRLTDLEIVGDRAKGTSVRGGMEFNMSSPIAFVKIGDAWYVSGAGM